MYPSPLLSNLHTHYPFAFSLGILDIPLLHEELVSHDQSTEKCTAKRSEIPEDKADTGVWRLLGGWWSLLPWQIGFLGSPHL